MPFATEGVDDLDLALFDIHEAVNPIARSHDNGACRVTGLGAFGSHCRHMGGGQRDPLHLIQVTADGLQVLSPLSLTLPSGRS